MTNPTYYETIVNSDIFKEWTRHQEEALEFDIWESIETGWLSPEHWQAFIKWVEERAKEEEAIAHQKEDLNAFEEGRKFERRNLKADEYEEF